MAPPATLPAVLIFAATYLVLAVGRLPGFRVDRTGAAIIGATLVVALNILTVPDAIDAINTDTIILLFGMMIAVAMASNIGSVATITGNPQNMLVGSFSGIPYRDFAAALSPVAAVGLLVLVAMIMLIYRREFLIVAPRVIIEPPPVRVHRAL